jgi:hypothetical protein
VKESIDMEEKGAVENIGADGTVIGMKDRVIMEDIGVMVERVVKDIGVMVDMGVIMDGIVAGIMGITIITTIITIITIIMGIMDTDNIMDTVLNMADIGVRS